MYHLLFYVFVLGNHTKKSNSSKYRIEGNFRQEYSAESLIHNQVFISSLGLLRQQQFICRVIFFVGLVLSLIDFDESDENV